MVVEAPESPVFSVVTIFQNEERFLSDAVASVAAQTGPSFELILVDDGSTDRSADLARVLATAFPAWISCVTHPDAANRGMSASRNLGIKHATGEFVTFLDADDVWLPGKLAAQLALLRNHPGVDILVSPAQWWWSWGHGSNEHDRDQRLIGVDGDDDHEVEVAPPPGLVRQFLADEWKSICDLVVRKQLLDQVGGYEETFPGMFEDQVFHTKLLSRHRAVVTRRHWYLYRQHDQACTATIHDAGGHSAARSRFLQWAMNHLQAQSPPPPAVAQDEWLDFVNFVRDQHRQARRTARIQRLRRQVAGMVTPIWGGRPRP